MSKIDLVVATSTRYSNRFCVARGVALTVIGLGGIVSLAFAYGLERRAVAESFFRILVLVPGVLTLLLGTRAFAVSSDRAAQVYSALRVPQHLWHRWLGAGLRELTLLWLLLIAVVAAFVATDGGRLPRLLEFAAATSSCMALIAVLTLQTGKLERGRTRELWMLLIMVVVAVFGLGTSHRLMQVSPPELPSMLYLAGLLAWPVFVAVSWYRWREPRLRADVPHPDIGSDAAARWPTGLLQRLAVVHLWLWKNPQANYHGLQTRSLSRFLGDGLLFAFVFDMIVNTMPATPTEPLYLAHLLLVPLLAVVPSNMLACHGLHWRQVLLPRTVGRERLGTRVFLSTLVPSLLVLALYIGLPELLWGQDLRDTIAQNWSPTLDALRGTLLKLAASVALATLLVSLPWSGRILAAALAANALAAGVFVWHYGWAVGPVLGHFDAPVQFALAIFTVTAILVADRLLSPQRLLRAASSF